MTAMSDEDEWGHCRRWAPPYRYGLSIYYGGDCFFSVFIDPDEEHERLWTEDSPYFVVKFPSSHHKSTMLEAPCVDGVVLLYFYGRDREWFYVAIDLPSANVTEYRPHDPFPEQLTQIAKSLKHETRYEQHVNAQARGTRERQKLPCDDIREFFPCVTSVVTKTPTDGGSRTRKAWVALPAVTYACPFCGKAVMGGVCRCGARVTEVSWGKMSCPRCLRAGKSCLWKDYPDDDCPFFEVDPEKL